MTCDVCGRSDFRDDRIVETFSVGGKLFVVEAIPAQICNRCGEVSLSAHVAEEVRQLVHGPHRPERVVEAEVLLYRAA